MLQTTGAPEEADVFNKWTKADPKRRLEFESADSKFIFNDDQRVTHTHRHDDDHPH